jgi:tripartite ATP-independent transporter DctP family solute receptor
MKKKPLLFVVLLALTMISLACSSESTQSPTEPTKETAKETTKEQETTKETDSKVYKIKLGHSDKAGDDSIIDWTARKFAELAKEYSDGRIEVEIYPSKQLGDNLEGMRSLQNGSQEMVQGSVAQFGQFAPSINYLGLPYIFTGQDQAREAIDALWDKNNEFLTSQANMRFLLWTDAGFRNLTTDKDHPVRSLEDMNGVKVRIPPNPISEAAFTTFGAQTVTLPFSEVFTALQQGVVNGQENANTTAVTEHYYETQKYVTDIQWQYTISAFAISEDYFQGLPKDLQDALVKAGKDATQAERERFDEFNKQDIQYLKDNGMEFLGLPTDYDQWVEKGRSIWPEAYKTIGGGDEAKGKEIVDSLLEIIK